MNAARAQGRPTLTEIDPAVVARETVQRVIDDLGRRILALSPSAAPWPGARPEETDLYTSIIDLCAWAQRGEGHADEVDDLCLSVVTGVYPAALDGSDRSPELRDLSADADPQTPIGLLVVAALARERIARRLPVTARDLAVLAGVDPQHVRLLIRRGEIEAEDGTVPAKEAKRWLGARAVPGFGARR